MTEHIWIDGRIDRLGAVTGTVDSFSLHYGYAVFEGIRAFDVGAETPKLFELEAHLDRLLQSAALIGIEMSWGIEDIAAGVREVVRLSGHRSAYVRPIAFVGSGLRGLATDGYAGHMAIMSWEWKAADADGPGLDLVTSAWRRPGPRSVPVQAKASGNYLLSKLAFDEAKAAGADDALLLDDRGYVAEASAMNVFAVVDGTLRTPTTYGCLAGITRRAVMRLAAEHGVPVAECDFTPKTMRAADEAFVTSTAAGVRPIASLDGTRFGDGRAGPLTRAMQAHYQRLTLESQSEMLGTEERP